LAIVGLDTGTAKWKPVAVSYTIPVRFNLQTNEEKMPQFPGEKKPFLKYIMDNLKYPSEAIKESAQGKSICHILPSKRMAKWKT